MAEHRSWTTPNALGSQIGRRRVLRGAVLGGAGLTAAALIGCTAGKKDKDGAVAPASGAKAARAPKSGGRLTAVIQADPTYLDLHRGGSTNTVRSAGPAHNQLVQFDPMKPVEGPSTVIPDLGEKWEISPDGLTYSFSLVKNAKFHDGTPFTSADVKASIERIQNPPSGVAFPYYKELAAIASVTTPDANTAVLKLSRPVSSLTLLPTLAQPWHTIYSQKDIAGKFDFNKQQNGTGPFRFKVHEHGSKVSLDKYADYHIKGRPYLDGIDVFVIPDISTRLANSQSGSLDVQAAPGLTQQDIDAMKKSMGDKGVFHSGIGFGFPSIDFNAARAPWSDQRVRQAVALALNKPDAIKVAFQGDGHLGGYMQPGGPWALSQGELEKIPGYGPYKEADVAEAMKLISAAGVPNGFELTLPTINTKRDQDLGVYLADQLKKLGMKATLNVIESPAYNVLVEKRDFAIVTATSAYGVDDPDLVFATNYLTGAPRNASGLKTPELDALWLKQSQELNPERRKELAKDLQKMALPLYGRVVLLWQNRHAISQKWVKDYAFHPSLWNNPRFQDSWIDK